MADVRLFVSVAVPDTRELASLRGELRAAGARASPPEQTHLTLRFIGDVDESRVNDVAAAAKAAVAGVGPFRVELSGVGAFPNRHNPSVVWVGAEPADVLGGIADRLGRELSARGIGYDSKPFKAHVTVGRCRGGLGSQDVFSRRRAGPFASFECAEVLVMRSVLGPSGARHSVLRRIPLGGAR